MPLLVRDEIDVEDIRRLKYLSEAVLKHLWNAHTTIEEDDDFEYSENDGDVYNQLLTAIAFQEELRKTLVNKLFIYGVIDGK
jgi:hypothetical protein|tara:strand:- start:12 stop:257 length:246 start_codon:yes stop_codon:yes gene_type:complete